MKKTSFLLLASGLLFWISCAKELSSDPSLTGVSGSITRFAIFDKYMYALNLNEVLTYSLENPDNPILVNRLSTDYGLETITLYDSTIFIGSTSALYILDISKPAAPVLQAKTERNEFFIGGCDPVVVKDNYAYSTIKIIENVCGRRSAQSALIVYDVSNQSFPVEVSTLPLNIPNGLGYKENRLFVCDEGSDRLEVFDISNPKQIEKTTQVIPITDPVDLIVYGEKMIVSSKTNFEIYDLSDLDHVKKIGEIKKK